MNNGESVGNAFPGVGGIPLSEALGQLRGGRGFGHEHIDIGRAEKIIERVRPASTASLVFVGVYFILVATGAAKLPRGRRRRTLYVMGTWLSVNAAASIGLRRPRRARPPPQLCDPCPRRRRWSGPLTDQEFEPLAWGPGIWELLKHARDVARIYQAREVEIVHVLVAIDTHGEGGPSAVPRDVLYDALRFHREQFFAENARAPAHPNLIAHLARNRFQVVRDVPEVEKSQRHHPAGRLSHLVEHSD